ncbi:alcohol dehydrogenase [Basidiobolus meristosporus CBS 931.73]|uniref:Alcohol dehydrogenase n=1 Tax=Basidiobolus meristosporus CBS 931.73 TaxID=1314790 RepID=A0A1Y1YHV0_9FUNG|nr:alcohol dehydrogenase [Basidiobolus meristosporus CBS 931.73]|eukprot:ORX97592.1 alcohol dehydrogenase [Basidiobolus meristosporus CBS 931.73]
MRAIVVKDKWLDSVEQLQVLEDVPEPKPKAGQVLVEVKAAGANFFDILMVQGKYQIKPPFPFVPGSEFAGVVIEAHPSVTQYKKGDRVFGSTLGCYAEKAVAPVASTHKIPEGMSFEEAAGLFITYPTSYAALVLRANLQKDEVCLVHAGAGGVGVAAIQIAKALGAEVIATAGSSEKLEVAKANGADYCINYREDKNWPETVKKITKGKGANVVFDPVGLIEVSMKCVAWNGRIVVVGFAAGKIEKVAVNRILLKNIAVMGVHWGAYTKYQPEQIQPVWDSLFKLFADRKLKPVVYKTVYHGLEKVQGALTDISERKTYGKVVVIPSAPTGARNKL